MKPPHWQCQSCGYIITDSGRQPQSCPHCSGNNFQCLGFEGGYNEQQALELYTIKQPSIPQLTPIFSNTKDQVTTSSIEIQEIFKDIAQTKKDKKKCQK